EGTEIVILLSSVRARPQVDDGRHPALSERSKPDGARLRAPPYAVVYDIELPNALEIGTGFEIRGCASEPAGPDEQEISLHQRAERGGKNDEGNQAQTARPTRGRGFGDGRGFRNGRGHRVRKGVGDSKYTEHGYLR